MILYEVTLGVESRLAGQVESYMRHVHVPSIFATRCFRRIRFYQASAGLFRTSYEASSQADLDCYIESHAPRMRQEFQIMFPAGVSITRTIWTEREVWE